MKKTFKKITAAVMAATTLAVGMTGMTASARQIREFSDIRAYVGSETKVSSYPLTKSGSGDAVFNYSGGNASGDNSMVTAVIRNSNGSNRGSCSATKGQRKVFSTSASKNYEYDLYVAKTYSGSSILVSGSWSPDES